MSICSLPLGLQIRWRLDGVLQTVGVFPRGQSTDVVSRLKVLAELLTYRNDVPQEGRIRQVRNEIEMRVSTFPTLHGERAVVRLFAARQTFLYPENLGLPAQIEQELCQATTERSGLILLGGPAGSGKTTTAYALLRQLVRSSGNSISLVTLEDPIEMALDGVAQSQVNPAAGFDFAVGLRSLMRQDPEVLLVGEIRDRATVEIAYQAALTGHLVITTFHAGSAATAVSRLLDMGIEPYLLRSGTRAIVCQRLLRKLCRCARQNCDSDPRLGLAIEQFRVPVGCAECSGTGYAGRLVVAEMLSVQPAPVARAVLERQDSASSNNRRSKRDDHLLQACRRGHPARRNQPRRTTELEALLPSVLDKAFRGEL
jgi:general secretion pathway protein E